MKSPAIKVLRFKLPIRFTALNFSVSYKDRLIFVVVTIPAIVFFNYLIFGPAYFINPLQLVVSTAIAVAACGIIWFTLMHGMYFFRRKFPSLQDTAERAVYSFLLYAGVTFLISLLLLISYDYFGFYGFQLHHPLLLKVIGIGLVSNVLHLGSYELIYTLEKWKESLKLKEELEKERVQHELNSLKSQVNPHFLFNSLSSLSALIEDNPAEAEKFLDEMSKVYRYMLRNNSQQVATLFQEMQFIESYYHLLKIRYGEGLNLQLSLDESHHNLGLPPFALQTVVDSALKSNITLKEQPLHIKIDIQGNCLRAVHSLQQKDILVDTDQVNQHSMGANSRLVKFYNVRITESENERQVLIPLISLTGKTAEV